MQARQLHLDAYAIQGVFNTVVIQKIVDFIKDVAFLLQTVMFLPCRVLSFLVTFAIGLLAKLFAYGSSGSPCF